MKVVLVVTSASELKCGYPTGLWLEELAAPYYEFKEAGYDVTLASPKGGPAPIDGNSLGEGFFTNVAKKFMHDGEAVGKLSHTAALSSVDVDSIDAIYFTGGHGTCVDFHDNAMVKKVVEDTYNSNKVVAAVCHGVNCLVDCVSQEDGKTPLIAGKVVTGFNNSEEEAVQLTSKVPFLIETKFIKLGAKYEKGPDWSSKVCIDGNLMTGQNPQSSEDLAKAVVKKLGEKE